MMRAAVTNTQIEWILEDDDVFEFFTKLAHQYSEDIDPATRAAFWTEFESADEWPDEDES